MARKSSIPVKLLSIILCFVALGNRVHAQCTEALGDEVSYGSEEWIGYVYNQVRNFDAVNYQGFVTETEEFDQSFCGAQCTYTVNGCDITTDYFTVRYKMRKTFAPGVYLLTLGGDDGVRLSIDGGSNYILGSWNDNAYTTYSTALCLLDGSYDMVLDYYERGSQNRISFHYTYYGDLYGGEVAGNQDLCSTGTMDPAAFTNTRAAASCNAGPFVYQWQESVDNNTWSNLASASGLTYNIPSGAIGTKYYRRMVTDGIETAYSNTLTVYANTPQGDEATYGDESWIGYVYDGQDIYSSAAFRGEIFESESFDENFGGETAVFATSGCNTLATTFSVRFRMKKNFPWGNYSLTVGADDGVRLIVDGATVIDDYSDHSYRIRTTTMELNGDHDLILEYYENGGGNRISFDYNLEAILPVSLTHFSGYIDEKAAHLNWITASEENNAHFLVQKSADGKYFETIGKLPGRGNSQKKTNYSYTDRYPYPGVNYYRLKQVDINGASMYSEIILLSHTGSEEVKLFPNPANGVITVDYPNKSRKDAYIKMFTLRGKQVKAVTLSYKTDWKFDVSDLSPSVYLLELSVDQKKIYKKMVVGGL